MCGVRRWSKAANHFTGTLAHPPSNTGALSESWAFAISWPRPRALRAPPQFYADAAVIAYRRPASDVPVESLHPKMTASAGAPDAAMLERRRSGKDDQASDPESRREHLDPI